MSAKATHLVGGEVYYTPIDPASNRYLISVQIFLDCQDGDDGAIETDKELVISLWNARTGTFIRDFNMIRNSFTEVKNSQTYKCLNEPDNVCISSFVFNREIVVDPGNDGVIVAWQRCCRNGKIDNIIDPGGSGFTAWNIIPPKIIVNSSPQFKEIPPIYVCVNAPLEFSQLAEDADGDSLVYSFVTPFLGGADDPVEKIRPNNIATYDRPPFRNLIWRAPYNSQNQLPSEPRLNIDASTGLVTATPTRTGEYTIGIAVKEYREGLLIGETRRDYQISIIDCDFDVLANFAIDGGTASGGSYIFECGDTVEILNRSIVNPAFAHSFFWDFGDPTTTSDTLTTFRLNTPISYVYPGNGDYTITLTVKSVLCEDEYNYNVKIRSSKPFEFGPDRFYCQDFRTVIDTDAPDAIDIIWSTGEKESRIFTSDTGTYHVRVSYGQCFYDDTITLRREDLPEPDLLADSLFCDAVDLTLDIGVDAPNYLWLTPERQTTRTIQVTEAGLYIAQIKGDFCIKLDTAKIWQAIKPEIDDQFFCGDFDFLADAGLLEEAEYLWSNNGVEQTSTYTTGGVHWIQIIQRHCIKSDTFTIQNPIINLELGVDTHFCDFIDLTLDAGEDGAIYEWSNGLGTRTIRPTEPGTYAVKVIDIFNCESEDSITLTLSESPIFELGDDTVICINQPTALIAPEGFMYEWSNGSIEQVITVTQGSEYTVMITDDFGCTGIDTQRVTVDPTALPSLLYFPNAFTPNNDGLNEAFPYAESSEQLGFEIKIYNRWGELLFDSIREGTNSWDGYYKGEKVQPGVYMFTAYYRGCDGNARNQSGTFHTIW